MGEAEHLVLTPQRVLSDAFIAERQSHLSETMAQSQVDPGPALTSSETVYLTAADTAGSMVSFIKCYVVSPLHDGGTALTSIKRDEEDELLSCDAPRSAAWVVAHFLRTP